MENRSGLVRLACATRATGTAERDASLGLIDRLRQARHRGIERVGWIFTLAAAAYNLVRLPALLRPAA